MSRVALDAIGPSALISSFIITWMAMVHWSLSDSSVDPSSYRSTSFGLLACETPFRRSCLRKHGSATLQHETLSTATNSRHSALPSITSVLYAGARLKSCRLYTLQVSCCAKQLDVFKMSPEQVP